MYFIIGVYFISLILTLWLWNPNLLIKVAIKKIAEKNKNDSVRKSQNFGDAERK